MKTNTKKDDAYKTIGEVARELNLVDEKTGHLQTHTIRYWETQFKQLKPFIKAGKRRYYSKNDFKIIKLIKFLLKEKGLTILGAKKVLDNSEIGSIDADVNIGLYKRDLKVSRIIKEKIKKISKIVREIKKMK